MTTLAVVTGFCLALVLVLGWAVVVLRRDLAGLRLELQEARDSEPVRTDPGPAAPVTDEAHSPLGPPPEPAPTVRTVLSFDGRDDEQTTSPGGAGDGAGSPEEDVPVITRMAEPVDEVDLTTRRVASVTLARPLIKVAALGHGVRRALDDEHRLRVRLTMKRELKRQRKMRRRRRADGGASQGWDR